MIRVDDATLRIKKIRQSRNGAFCIADLTTNFGEFKVKDPLLDQFEEGEYKATVWVSEIYLSQYISFGKGVTEIRARLHDLQVVSQDRLPADRTPTELDPLDEPTPVKGQTKASEPSKEQCRGAAQHADKRWDDFKKPRPAPAPESVEAVDDGLFDADLLEAIERADPVKLDPTVDRALLRSQAAWLRKQGYDFDPKLQTWFAKR
ncbi:DUF3275 family protein [Paracidovorax valerianellae]|uniref:DUF3275 family protein n=1 Tax=Paracidovorax valerianellae TaxID=187868 RepID=A0A1G7F934_9BURK|nr:DUF3275 family protein [Paracidovorax valerianellae]MDA8443627.1 DUF3275 family protein [Paracidovorax valerianellae]SDE72346.1 Protein of unknown function [Paracidovorax valerianellae]